MSTKKLKTKSAFTKRLQVRQLAGAALAKTGVGQPRRKMTRPFGPWRFTKGFQYFLLFLLFFVIRLLFLHHSDYPLDKPVEVIGRAQNEPYLSGSKQIILIDDLKVVTDPFPEVLHGDKVSAFGKIEKEVLENGKTNFCLYTKEISILNQGEGAPIWTKIRRFLINLRHYLEGVFGAFLPEPQASLLSGILLGSRKTMPEVLFADLKKTGTLHLIAASGQNVSIIAGFLISGLVLLFKRKIALTLAILGILAYALMAGAEPPIVRAAIMGTLTFLAQFLGRESQAIRTLVFSALLMLFVNPLIIFDVGFQLSFAATSGILFGLPVLERKRFFRHNFWGRELGLTLSAQIGILPITLYHFGSVSLFSPLVNLLVAPLVPLTMNFGVVLLISGLISARFAPIFAVSVWVLLTLITKIIHFFAHFLGQSLVINHFPLWGVFLFYSILICSLIYLPKLKNEPKN